MQKNIVPLVNVRFTQRQYFWFLKQVEKEETNYNAYIKKLVDAEMVRIAELEKEKNQ